jgi:hypothetical protein
MVNPRLDGLISARQLRMLLHYDPATGLFVWKRREEAPQWNGRYAGKVAGTPKTGAGYILIKLPPHRRAYHAHRLAFLWMTGKWPRAEVDHRDGDQANNTWENLRSCTVSQNRMNSVRRRDNKTGFKGVGRENRRWRADIMVDYQRHYLGTYDTPEEAHAAYVEAARRLHGEFARHD